ncbi:hypothetical protein Adt_07111 [Abeliophyllum distichum]|uniref:Uncharacterized protein n=1 Tax=Abeliophyllum distichum TaxID=126358 RepID=A0ABD1V8T6_9LAMI
MWRAVKVTSSSTLPNSSHHSHNLYTTTATYKRIGILYTMLGGFYSDLPYCLPPEMIILPPHPLLVSGQKVPRWLHPPFANPFLFSRPYANPNSRSPNPPKVQKLNFSLMKNTNPNPNMALFYPASVIKEYDPARPNDYEDYCTTVEAS